MILVIEYLGNRVIDIFGKIDERGCAVPADTNRQLTCGLPRLDDGVRIPAGFLSNGRGIAMKWNRLGRGGGQVRKGSRKGLSFGAKAQMVTRTKHSG